MQSITKKIFILVIILFSNYSNSQAIEAFVAKTQKPKELTEQTKLQKELAEQAAPTAQTDGMEIPSPTDLVKKVFKKTDQPKTEVAEAPQGDSSTMTLDSDEIEYNDETKEIEARGNVVIISKSEKVKIIADRGTLNHATNIVKLYDNITIYKDGAEIKGHYMAIDLNEQNVLMDKPIATYGIIKVTSKEGYAYANKIESINGQAEIVKKMDITLATRGFSSYYDQTIIQKDLATDEMKKKRSEPYKIHTKEIIIKSDKDHDIVTIKNAQIYYKTHKILTVPKLQLYTDKEQSYIETNIPEIGSMGGFGTFLGPSFVFKTPPGATLKISPVLVSDSGFGAGAIIRARSKRNYVEAGWNSASNNVVGRGYYKFNDNLRLEYSRHAYTDEWLFGYRRAGYIAQLTHKKTWDVPNLKAKYRQMVSAGYVEEYSKKHQADMDGTSRLRWQGQLSKNFFSIGDREQEAFIDFGGVVSAAATLYGTGDTFAMARIGPNIQSRLKNWGSRIHATVGGIHGDSPYQFDRYRYGKVSISVDQNYRFNRYLAAGYQGMFAPLKDNFEKKLVVENRFYVMAGPDDIKVAFSYDTERSLAGFDVMFLLGGDNLKASYDKFSVEQYEKLGKKRDFLEDVKLNKIKIPKIDENPESSDSDKL